MSRPVAVSVVLPAYNEADTIGETVATALDTLAEFLPRDSFEVLIAEDGCEDRTPEIAERLAAEDQRVRHVHSEERLGRGGALERAFRAAEGDTLAYFDTDLATDMRHLEELIESVRSGSYEFATGSRWIEGADADRPTQRSVLSRGYNLAIRGLLRSSLEDHQCGFKAFDRTALFDVLAGVEDDHWFWDTEVLVRAQRAGYRIHEFPVEWTPMGDTKVDLVRDVFGMGSQIIRTWWQLSVRPRLSRRVAIVAGIALTALALAFMTQYLNFERVLEEIGDADLRLVGLAGGIYVLSWPLRGVRYRDILGELGFDSRVGFMTGAVFISQTGNLVVPARLGDAIRAYIVKTRRRVPYPAGFASLAVERVFDLLTITALAGVTLVVLAGIGGTSAAGLAEAVVRGGQSGQVAVAAALAVGVAALAALAAIVLSARSDRNLARATLGRLSPDAYADRLVGVVERFGRDVQVVASDRRAFARVGASSIGIWTLDVVTAALVLAAFDVSLAPVTLLAVSFFAVSVGNLAKVLPLSPGGIGLYEGAFTTLVLALTPIPFEVAFAAAIVDHAVKNVITVIGGIASTLLLNVSLTTAVEESRNIDPEPAPEAYSRGPD